MTLIQKRLIQYISQLEEKQQAALLAIVESMVQKEEENTKTEKDTANDSGEEEEFDIWSIPFDSEPTEAEKEVAYLLANTNKGKPTKDFFSIVGAISSEDIKLMEEAINDPEWGCNRIEDDQ